VRNSFRRAVQNLPFRTPKPSRSEGVLKIITHDSTSRPAVPESTPAFRIRSDPRAPDRTARLVLGGKQLGCSRRKREPCPPTTLRSSGRTESPCGRRWTGAPSGPVLGSGRTPDSTPGQLSPENRRRERAGDRNQPLQRSRH
jgi:hypothetical protein